MPHSAKLFRAPTARGLADVAGRAPTYATAPASSAQISTPFIHPSPERNRDVQEMWGQKDSKW